MWIIIAQVHSFSQLQKIPLLAYTTIYLSILLLMGHFGCFWLFTSNHATSGIIAGIPLNMSEFFHVGVELLACPAHTSSPSLITRKLLSEATVLIVLPLATLEGCCCRTSLPKFAIIQSWKRWTLRDLRFLFSFLKIWMVPYWFGVMLKCKHSLDFYSVE